MPITVLLEKARKFEIQTYRKKILEYQNVLKDLKVDHIPFTGCPKIHPNDSSKIILISDPFSTHTYYLQFNMDDITYAEELPSIVNLDGETMIMARVWVRKKSIGIRSTPFIVDHFQGNHGL